MIRWAVIMMSLGALAHTRALGSDEALVAEILPSVVQVFVDIGPAATPRDEEDWAPEGFEHYFGPRRGPRDQGQGSGFLVDPPGTVVTCAHVVRDAVSCRVRLNDGRELVAQVIGEDPNSDLAILRIPASDPPMPTLTWGASREVRPGQEVFSFGSPLGFTNTVSKGIVAGIDRQGPWNGSPHFLQTDAFLDSGSSGGPLVNAAGAVIGVNSWIVTGGGRRPGFALPADLAREVVNGLMQADRTDAPGWLGILPVASADPGLAVFDVMVGSPADRAGLRPGDQIVAVDKDTLVSEELFRAILGNRRAGSVLDGLLQPGRRPFSARLMVDPAQWNGGMRQPLTGMSAPADPGVLEAVLTGRDCPCPCGRTLQNCFGCSAAKSDFTDARRYAREGVGKAEMARLLDPPLPALVWFDPLDEASRALLRLLDQLSERCAGAMRVRRRYLPAPGTDRDAWARAVISLEVARSQGRYEDAYRAMLASPTGQPGDGEFFGVSEADVDRALDEGRYAQQLARDLTAGPTQYGVEVAPALLLIDAHYKGALDLESLAGHLDTLLLEGSL